MRLLLLLTLALCVAPPQYAGGQPSASVRVAILVADAEKLYREGKQKEAVRLYDRAAARAFSEGARGRAFELSRTAAAVLDAIGEPANAGGRLRRLAMAHPDHADAPQTYVDALVCLARVPPDERDAATDYLAALDEFLKQWPTHAHADSVRWWRANALAACQDWEAAVSAQLAAEPPAARRAQTLALLGVAGEARITEMKEQDLPPEASKALVLRLTNRLKPIITGQQNRWPDRWTSAQRSAAVSLARVHLAYGRSGRDYPYRIIVAAVEGDPPADAPWLETALPVLVAASVNARDFDRAVSACADLDPNANEPAASLADRLERWAMESEHGPRIGEVLLALARRYEDAPQATWAPRAVAVGNALRGAPQPGATEALAEHGPADKRLLGLQAAALGRSASEEDLNRAITLYKQLEAREPPSSRAWYAARLNRVELLLALGQRGTAKKLLDLTRTLHPRPAGDALAEQFDRLQEKLE